MSALSAYSETLATSESKRLLDFIQKPGKNAFWKDWSGDGGSETETKLTNVACFTLDNIVFPDFCTSVGVFSGATLRKKSDKIDVNILGGAWDPPEFGDSSYVRYCIFIEKIAAFVSVTLEKRGGMRHYGRPYNYCSFFSLKWAQGSLRPDLSVPEAFRKRNPESIEIESFISDVWKHYSLPDESSEGWLETRKFEGQELGYYMNLDCFDDIRRSVSELVCDMISKSPCEQYVTRGGASVGEAANFEGERHNVTKVGKDLLRRVAEYNAFESYEVCYGSLGPRNWKDREKFRKKLKEPGHEQLGKLTLETGAVAEVGLGIEKEGYVFYLNFGNDDDLIKFYHSKLFQKTKWHSGAE